MPAHYQIVEGVALPAPLGGHPALDFCNTWTGWDGHDPGDFLKSYDHLAIWAGFVGLLGPDRTASLRRLQARQMRSASAVLEAARSFRGDLYDVLLGRGGGRARDAVAEQVHQAASAALLRPSEGGFRWEIDPRSGLWAPLFAAAWSAADLLISDTLPLVRACPGTGCGWLFLDRRGRRRWCTMAACGNRQKVRRFAERRRAGASRSTD